MDSLEQLKIDLIETADTISNNREISPEQIETATSLYVSMQGTSIEELPTDHLERLNTVLAHYAPKGSRLQALNALSIAKSDLHYKKDLYSAAYQLSIAQEARSQLNRDEVKILDQTILDGLSPDKPIKELSDSERRQKYQFSNVIYNESSFLREHKAMAALNRALLAGYAGKDKQTIADNIVEADILRLDLSPEHQEALDKGINIYVKSAIPDEDYPAHYATFNYDISDKISCNSKVSPSLRNAARISCLCLARAARLTADSTMSLITSIDRNRSELAPDQRNVANALIATYLQPQKPKDGVSQLTLSDNLAVCSSLLWNIDYNPRLNALVKLSRAQIGNAINSKPHDMARYLNSIDKDRENLSPEHIKALDGLMEESLKNPEVADRFNSLKR